MQHWSAHQRVGGRGYSRKNVSMVLPPEMMAMLMQDLNISMEPVRVVGGNQIRALVDAVRDQLLTWALDLVEAGIEGMKCPPHPSRWRRLPFASRAGSTVVN